MEKDELAAAQKYFKCVDLITNIPENSLVIGRFSLYPFYYDQEREIKNKNSKLINEHWQYEYIADLQNYVYDLEDLTPRTWDRLDILPENTKFVLKGETNSRKNSWKTSMFAENKKQAIEIHGKLLEDSLIGSQKIYIREYVPLYTYMIGINGAPVTKEYRFFIAYGKVISGAYYWQNYVDDFHNFPSFRIYDMPLMPKHVHIFFLLQVYRTKRVSVLREFAFPLDIRMFDLESSHPKVTLIHQPLAPNSG